MQVSTRLTAQALGNIKIIEEIALSPNGETVLFTQKTLNLKKNNYESRFYALPFTAASSTPKPLTAGPHDTFPRFSPDGKLVAFLRKIGKHNQIHLMPLNGGKIRRLTRVKDKISSITWSPDGKKLAFTAQVTEKGLRDENEKPEKDLEKKYTQDVKVIQRIWYKQDGSGFLHNVRSQIFVLDIKTGKIKQITFGEHEACFPQFSPNGKWIVFSSNRNPNSDAEYLSHIYVVSTHGGSPKNLTPGDYHFTNPAFSPDGKAIAFIGSDEPKNWYANPRLWTVSAQGKTLRCLTKSFDRAVSNQSITDIRGFEPGETPVWSDDSEKIYLSFSDSGHVNLGCVDVKTGRITFLAPEKNVVFAWSIAPKTQRAVLAKTDAVTPNDLWSLNLATHATARLTHVNHEFLHEYSLVVPERFPVKSPDGTAVDAWILKPPHFQKGKKYPAIVEIHGGPMAMYSESFFYEFQLLANRGFVVIYANPRGSMGYEQAFCEAIQGDWGNKDYQDILAALDSALALGFVDDKRLGVAGGSYGGFMTNWIIGHTDRFKAGVTMRSVTNEYSMYGTSDYGFLSEQNMGCFPWEKPDVYLNASPLSYVEKIKTPLLILHSEEDYRCPMEQAEQLFVALKKLGREVSFVRFPGESHDLSRTGKPWHRIYRLNQITRWFERNLV